MIPALALWVIVAISTGADPLAGADQGAAGFLGQAAEVYPTRSAAQFVALCVFVTH
jgi:hypothetical protein